MDNDGRRDPALDDDVQIDDDENPEWTAEDFANAKPLPLPRIKELKAVPQELPPVDLLKESFGSEAEGPTLPDEECYALGRTLFEYKPAERIEPRF